MSPNSDGFFRRHSGFGVSQIITLAMENPKPPIEIPNKAPIPDEMGILIAGNSPLNNLSEVSQPSSSGAVTLKSPFKANDLGIPMTPEGRAVKAIDESAIDAGYDSNGLRGPWEGANSDNFEGSEEEELPLPFGPGPSLPVEPLAKNVAEKW